MKFQAHRGVATEFPENTLPAFTAAIRQGYDYIELDPNYTADGKCVILHDSSINRTCRFKSGEKIPNIIKITEITYSEALKYDAGTAKAFKFRGTHIPLLSEALELAAGTGVTVKLDNKIQKFPAEILEELFRTVERVGAAVAFTFSDMGFIKAAVKRFPNAEIHYDGEVNKKKLEELKEVVSPGRLTVWLAMPCPATDWVTVPRADEKLCAAVKKYAKLGLWIIDTPEQLTDAERLGADIVETPGKLKPKRRAAGLFDCHTHSHFSHDSECDPRDSLAAAEKAGLSGFAVTDHCDIEFCRETDVETPILHSAETARRLGNTVMSGVEMGEAIFYPEVANALTEKAKFDIVLGSVHAARFGKITDPYSRIDFSAFSDEQIEKYLNAYFNDMKEMAQTADFDVLSHLTCPLRYICGKFGKEADISAFGDIIEDILKIIIEKGIALEVNTSCIGSGYNSLMPDEGILKLYRKLGGYLVTVGSDAHIASRISFGFETALGTLRRLGFENAYYYKNRIPIQYSLEDMK